jgi:hypothetical protein
LNSQERTFENSISQITAHAQNMQMVVISKFFTANIIFSYIHSNTSMKLPEIHGKIIAQIAIAPQMKVHHHEEVIERGSLVGEVMKNAITQNIIKHRIVFQFRLTCFQRNTAEIRINPKKNAQIKIG